MNILQAKEEIKYAIRIYLQKGDDGTYCLEERYCRPLLLVGAPGIGKTAIMQQIAGELGINLVSYTITHHTRQSAIGLPIVNKKIFDDHEYAITEYTMSEIIAALYNKIEDTGISEGILFLDEINCVSETLLPTMLQFLQYKTFGTHKVPRGFVICCAGNPPRYNRSARDFDIVTLDRVRRLEIDVDMDVFFRYARQAEVHGAVLAFMDIHKECFYRIRTDVEQTYYVTARSWEDLSQMLLAYEHSHFPITRDLMEEYLGDPEIAEEFYLYYGLYLKYHEEFAIRDILHGKQKEGSSAIKQAPFDEKLSLLHLLLDALHHEFCQYSNEKKAQIERRDLIRNNAFGDLPPVTAEEFERIEDERQDNIERLDERLSAVLAFLDRTYGQGQEMVIFLTRLGQDTFAKEYLADCGNERYDSYSGMLLLRDERRQLEREIMASKEREIP